MTMMTTGLKAFTATDFRRRVLQEGEGVAERENGDHVLNPGVVLSGNGIRLKDAAVLIPVIDDGNEARVIFTQRTATLRQHSGQISFPGGGIDAEDRTPEEAAARDGGRDRPFSFFRGDGWTAAGLYFRDGFSHQAGAVSRPPGL